MPGLSCLHFLSLEARTIPGTDGTFKKYQWKAHKNEQIFGARSASSAQQANTDFVEGLNGLRDWLWHQAVYVIGLCFGYVQDDDFIHQKGLWNPRENNVENCRIGSAHKGYYPALSSASKDCPTCLLPRPPYILQHEHQIQQRAGGQVNYLQGLVKTDHPHSECTA